MMSFINKFYHEITNTNSFPNYKTYSNHKNNLQGNPNTKKRTNSYAKT